jgi:hypothetical protein
MTATLRRESTLSIAISSTSGIGSGCETRIMAALGEEAFRMRLVKISTPDFSPRILCGNRQHGERTAVTIVKAVDQIQVTRPQLPAHAATNGGFSRNEISNVQRFVRFSEITGDF